MNYYSVYLSAFRRVVAQRNENPFAPQEATVKDFPEDFARATFLRISHRSNSGMTMSDTATLSSKYQISIPKAVRSARKWKAGQKFAFIPKGTGVLLVPVPEDGDLGGIAIGARAEDYRDRNDRF
jgi:AbrB family looped-hinge helix DNA binding protein